jgi:hypothetical protein
MGYLIVGGICLLLLVIFLCLIALIITLAMAIKSAEEHMDNIIEEGKR